MGAAKSLKQGELVVVSLLVIGLIGLLFLIIFGNLSGNLGFARETNTTTNESGAWINITPYTVDGFSIEGFVSFAVTGMWNNSEVVGTVIPPANFTVDSTAGTIVNATVITYSDVNLSYTVSFKGESERNTDSVIGNLTTGAVQFYSFSNVWFILTAITILIGIVIGVVALVRSVGKKSKFSA